MSENPIFFKVADGTVKQLDINPSAEVQDIFEWLREVFQIPDHKAISLSYNGQNLENNVVFGDVVPTNAEVSVKITTVHAEGAKRRSRRDLPARDGAKLPTNDPDDFNQKVAALMEIADDSEPQDELRTRCEKALRMAYYNVDRAGLYVLSRQIPDKRRPEIERNQRDGDNWRQQYPDKIDFIKQFLEKYSDLPQSVVVQICAGCEFDEEKCDQFLEREIEMEKGEE